MESISSIERRVGPGKTVSPRPTKLKAWAYKEFRLGDLFSIIKGKRLTKADSIPGDINFVGSSASNHGITAKIANSTHLHPGGTITVTYNGSVGEVFYQTDRFWASDDVNVLYSKHPMIESVALYFCAAIRKCGKKYGYAYKWTKDFMEKELLLLPITKAGKIDYAYMESRIREMEESRIREMEESRIREMNAYLNVTGFQNCELTAEEQNVLCLVDNGNVKFKSFHVTDDTNNGRHDGIFVVKNSHNILQSSITPNSGNIPYVTAGEGNNSISTYISYDKSQIEKGNTIMIGGKTMVITYQAEDFFSNDSHNLVLYVKNPLLANELIQLYLVASLNRSLKPIYSWGDSISSKKIKKDIFSLPVTPSGDIDYHFMETYIRAIEKLTIQRVKDWRAKEISATRDIVDSDMDNKLAVVENYKSHTYELKGERDTPMMVAEDILIYGSVEVRLRNTKKSDLLAGSLDLMLMYAISPTAREKTEKAGRIALGIKEANLSEEAVKAYQSVRYIMFHYWKNSEAKPFALTAPTRLVSRADVPEGFLLRQEKEAKQYLLLEYNPATPASIGELDILKAQRKGCNRYMPFVCRVENIIDSISH